MATTNGAGAKRIAFILSLPLPLHALNPRIRTSAIYFSISLSFPQGQCTYFPQLDIAVKKTNEPRILLEKVIPLPARSGRGDLDRSAMPEVAQPERGDGAFRLGAECAVYAPQRRFLKQGFERGRIGQFLPQVHRERIGAQQQRFPAQ